MGRIEIRATPPEGWPSCPECRLPAAAMVGEVTAMCGNDDCAVIMWDVPGREGRPVRVVP